MKYAIPCQRAEAIQDIKDCESGTVIIRQKKTRSLPQNDRIHGMIRQIAEEIEWHGHYLSMDKWKILFTAALKGQELLTGIDGNTVVFGYPTSELSVDEATQLQILIEMFAAEHGITQWNFEI